MSKPLCMYITTAPDYEGNWHLQLQFDDRRHWLYSGPNMPTPRNWACGLEISKLCLSYPLEFDEFMYLLSRMREPSSRLPDQHRTSCFPVWATTEFIDIGGFRIYVAEIRSTESREWMRTIYEDFWDQRLTAHN